MRLRVSLLDGGAPQGGARGVRLLLPAGASVAELHSLIERDWAATFAQPLAVLRLQDADGYALPPGCPAEQARPALPSFRPASA